MADKPDRLVPARYIGEHAVELGGGVKYLNIDGSKKQENYLSTGDTIMMPAEHVYGKTLWHDPHHNKPSRHVCLGRGVMDEKYNDVPHKELSEEVLKQIGYEFHQPRSDFEPLEPLEGLPPVEEPQQQEETSGFAVPADRITETPDEELEKKSGRKRSS